VLIGIAFALGILLGLLLGWHAWPVNWVDTDPADLRAEHQRDYVAMVADSWTVTGDLETARERLQGLVPEDAEADAYLPPLFTQTIAHLREANLEPAAVRVERLRAALRLTPASPTATPQTPKRHIVFKPRWSSLLIGLGVLILAIALIVWLVSRRLQRESAPVTPLDLGGPITAPRRSLWRREPPSPPTWPAPQPADEEESEEELPWEEEGLDLELEEEFPAAHRETTQPAVPPEPQPTALPVHPPAVTESEEPPEEPVPPELEEPLAPGIIEQQEVEYQHGNDDFYERFSLESPHQDFVGDYGIMTADVLGIDEHQLVDAFDLWLFDTESSHTDTAILASELAFDDPDLRARLNLKGRVLLAQPGLVVTLETDNLRLEALVEEIRYLSIPDMPNGVFEQLKVRLTVSRVEG